MKLSFMNSTWEKSNLIALTLLIGNLVLAVGITVAVISMSSQHERVVLNPPYLDKSVTVGWNSASAEYLKSYGMYFAILAANVTPKNISFVIDALSSSVAPEIYSEVRKRLLVLSKDPAFNNTAGSVRFEPTKVVYEADTSKVFVVGNVTTQTAVGKSDSAPMTYELIVVMREGKPVITGMNNYPGTEPHTLKWLESHPPQPIPVDKEMQ